ncbi:hypothetical protein ACQHIV_00435 [Kribbella sp. GL6]|uniref:hypothetical protein n=1 Tax=Kribbella sp. GL6 TaxID=3419765 RepID=UPI003CFD0792
MAWGRPVALLVLAGVLAGCGATNDSSGSGTPEIGTSTPGGQGSGPGSGNTGGNTGGGGGQGGGSLAWVPFGPKDPQFPTPSWPAYNALAAGKCPELQDYLSHDTGGLQGTGIATAMLAVCRAAVDGDTAQWPAVEQNVGADPAPLGNDCLAALVTDLLARAVAWHQAHPAGKVTVQYRRTTGQTQCGQAEAPSTEPTDEGSPGSSSSPESVPGPSESPG